MAYTDLFSFYRSREWETLRRTITLGRINEDGDLICEHCGKPILHEYDAICHHVEQLTEVNVFDPSIALNPDNIQVVHHRCHNIIHDRFQGGAVGSGTRHVYVVWGSPCAGKSAYVNENASPRDLVVDIDRLYEAISIQGNRKAVKSNVLAVYRGLIDMVKTRNGKWRTAWIIRTLPLEIDRESLSRELGGAEFIHINTPKDLCELEAEQRGGEWMDWTRQYWDRYQTPPPT